jgi:DNA-directed RNA polymerase subunit RPC12/RpoP
MEKPMIVTCPECDKKLKVADDAAGKKMRCPQCKAIVHVKRPVQEEAIEPAPKKPNPARSERLAADDDAADDAASGIRCARCDATAVETLAANAFSRRPGYRCKKCNLFMRPPGGRAIYVFVAVVGVLFFLGGIAALIAFLLNDLLKGPRIAGIAGILAIGALAAGWSIRQILLPTAVNAPPAPSGAVFIIIVLVIAFVLVPGCVGCLVFGLMYYMQEMM